MAPQNERAWLSGPELARRGNVSSRTATRWIIAYELGRKVGGRYRADRARAERFLTLLDTGAADDRRGS